MIAFQRSLRPFACMAASALLACTPSSPPPAPGAGAASGKAQANSGPLAACPAPPPTGTFDNALCLCGDYQDVGQGFTTSALDGGLANVGVNGRSQIVGDHNVDGNWVAYLGLSGVGSAGVKGDLVSIHDIQANGHLTIQHDLSVGGNLAGVGQLDVGGTLRVAGQKQFLGTEHEAATGAFSAPRGPPCACDPSTFFDVAAAVAKAKDHNDNGKVALPAAGVVGQRDLTLPTGSYYFTSVQTVGSTALHIRGAVAVYLEGSLDSVGSTNLDIAAGSTLDLYVSGGIRTVGQLDLGTGVPDGSLRLFLGGSDPVALSVGQQDLHAIIYAPTARVAFVGETTLQGALFANELQGVGRLNVRYTGPVAPAPGTCDPDGGTGGPGQDGGTPPGSGDGGTAPDGGTIG